MASYQVQLQRASELEGDHLAAYTHDIVKQAISATNPTSINLSRHTALPSFVNNRMWPWAACSEHIQHPRWAALTVRIDHCTGAHCLPDGTRCTTPTILTGTYTTITCSSLGTFAVLCSVGTEVTCWTYSSRGRLLRGNTCTLRRLCSRFIPAVDPKISLKRPRQTHIVIHRVSTLLQVTHEHNRARQCAPECDKRKSTAHLKHLERVQHEVGK